MGGGQGRWQEARTTPECEEEAAGGRQPPQKKGGVWKHFFSGCHFSLTPTAPFHATMPGDDDGAGAGAPTPAKTRARPRHLRKRALVADEEEAGASDGGGGGGGGSGGGGGGGAPPNAPPPSALAPVLDDLKFLQKQRGRRTVHFQRGEGGSRAYTVFPPCSHSPTKPRALCPSHPRCLSLSPPSQGITADSLLAAPARAAAGTVADLLAGAGAGAGGGGGATEGALAAAGGTALGGTYVRGADAAALAAAEAETEAQRFIEAELAVRKGGGQGGPGTDAAAGEAGGDAATSLGAHLSSVPAALRGQAAEAGPRIDAYMTGVVEVDVGVGGRLVALEAAEAERRRALGLEAAGVSATAGGGGGGGGAAGATREAFPKSFGGRGGRRR